MSLKRQRAFVVGVDILCLAAVGLPILLLKYFIQPRHSGFFCGDTSLRLPYYGSTIKTWVNVCLSYGIPLALIVLGNISKLKNSSFSLVAKCLYEETIFFLFGVFSVQVSWLTSSKMKSFHKMRYLKIFDVLATSLTLVTHLEFIDF